jgi:hypothetical protein
MQFKITHIVFDCTLDSDDWTDWDAIETADLLADRYAETVWEVDNEECLVDAISEKSGWCINEIDYEIIQEDDYDAPDVECVMEIDYTTQH